LRSATRAVIAVAAAVVVTSCSLDDVMHAVPWFGNMIRQPSIKPYAMTRPMPEGIVPIDGAEPEWQWPTADLTFVNALANPRTRTAESLTRGQQLYETYCAVCHGPTGGNAAGMGDGPVAQRLPGVPGLTTARARAYSDGYLYSMIRYGRGLMWRYGDKVRNPNDRWDVVNYMRQLQLQAAQQ